MSESRPDAGPLVYWEFICAEDGTWTWRTVRTEGDIVSQSLAFDGMQQAVKDAKMNGFNADSDHWSVTANGVTSTFEPSLPREPGYHRPMEGSNTGSETADRGDDTGMAPVATPAPRIHLLALALFGIAVVFYLGGSLTGAIVCTAAAAVVEIVFWIEFFLPLQDSRSERARRR